MKNPLKALWISTVLSLFLLSALPTAALTPAYPITGSYRSSTYHQNLAAIPQTGDLAYDVVAVAISQLGYHEGNRTADFDGQNQSGGGNYTEYNRAFGKVSGSYGYAWCATFVSWCLESVGAEEAAGGLFASCTLWVERLQALGQYQKRASGYTPKTGDLIFFRSAGVARASDHVGLVRYVQNGRVYTLEGNSSDRVSANSYSLSDGYIVGYGSPVYQSSYRVSKTVLQSEDRDPGLYSVTYTHLNVRATPSASAKKLGSLSHGALVRVVAVQNGWGRIDYNGKQGYISLEYADFAAPLSYTVRYESNGGEGEPTAQRYYSVERANAPSQAPTRAGYRFVGWQDAEGGLYQPGDALPLGDLTLRAAWEALAVAPTPEPPAEDVPPTEQAPSDALTEAPPAAPEAEPLPPQDAPDAASTQNRPAERLSAVLSGGGMAAYGGVLWLRRRREED